MKSKRMIDDGHQVMVKLILSLARFAKKNIKM